MAMQTAIAKAHTLILDMLPSEGMREIVDALPEEVVLPILCPILDACPPPNKPIILGAPQPNLPSWLQPGLPALSRPPPQ
jgi:hypothetical protein